MSQLERDLFSDDEEEEEEEEQGNLSAQETSEDEDNPRPLKKVKKRRNNASIFIEDQARVDEDDDDDDEDDAEDGFEEADNEAIDAKQTARDKAKYSKLDRQREQEQEEDAEEIAARLKQRYGRSAALGGFRGDLEHVPQSLLIPSVNDPKIWMVKCKPGAEKSIVFNMCRKFLNMETTKKPLQILSCFARDSLKGYIYLEAERQAHVTEAIERMNNVYGSKLHLVPVGEMVDCLRIKPKELDIKIQMWVRIKRGKYGGDLGQVLDITDTGEAATIKLIPRLDVTNSFGGTTKRKKGDIRPPQKLFNPNEVNKKEVSALQGVYQYQGETFDRDGYLEKVIKVSSLELKNVNPTLDEITKFSGGTVQNNSEDLTNLAASNSAKAEDFQAGEKVTVLQGEMKGMDGVVHTIDGSIVTIIPDAVYGIKNNVQYPAEELTKRFSDGDHAKVVNGLHKDESGLVIKVENNIVTLLSDTTLKPIEVFAKDLRSALEATAIIPSTSQYEIHDLVQLGPNELGVIIKMEKDVITLLDPFGSVIKVKPQQIRSRRDSGRAVTSDMNGKPITAKDPVMVMDDNGSNKRQAKVLHVYRQHVFLHSRDVQENSGVFVARSSNVVLISAKGVNGSSQGGFPNQPRSVPSIGGRPRGRDPLQGKTVTVTGGPFKGYLGIVKDVTENTARVELHTHNRTITIEKSKITVKGEESSQSRPNYQASRMGGRSAYDAARTPMHSGAKTPYGDNQGSRTPAWNAGSKTPAWDAGSKTPAWDAGSKTPAWDAGSKTPAWDAGSRTPAVGRMVPNTPMEVPTPYNATPGAFPATPANAITPYPNMATNNPTTPGLTPGVYPQTPAVPGVNDYAMPASSSTSLRGNWITTNIEVIVQSNRRFASGSSDGHHGVIKSIDGVRAQIFLDSGESVLVPEEFLVPVVPQKKESFKVLTGEERGKIGNLLSIDGHEGVVKLEGVEDILMMDMNTLAKYAG